MSSFLKTLDCSIQGQSKNDDDYFLGFARHPINIEKTPLVHSINSISFYLSPYKLNILSLSTSTTPFVLYEASPLL